MARNYQPLESLFRNSVPLRKSDSGVYGIVNGVTGKIYIGSSKNLSGRRACHKYDLRFDRNSVREFRDEVVKNPEAFEFVVIEKVKDEDSSVLIEREQFWINFYQSYLTGFGYNKSPTAGSCAGIKQSDEIIERRVSKIRGRKMPPRSEEHKRKIGMAHKGKKLSLDEIARRTATYRSNRLRGLHAR